MIDDYAELAAKLLGLPCETEEDEEAIEKSLYNKYDVDLSTFGTLVDALLPFTYPLKSPLSGELMHTFGYAETDGDVWVALAKTPWKGEGNAHQP